jgi:TfoX/Sxy family transcriptional regulator of competence genes
MFGEYGLYSSGKMVALVCDDALYVKPTAAGRAFIRRLRGRAALPERQAAFFNRSGALG